MLKLFVLQSKHMNFSEILSDKGTNLQNLNHKKHVRLQTIHSTELAFVGVTPFIRVSQRS